MAQPNEPVKETVEHPETVQPVKEVPPPVTEHPEEAKDDLKETVEAIAAKVEELTVAVAGIAPGPSDTSPVKRPWTHWGSK